MRSYADLTDEEITEKAKKEWLPGAKHPRYTGVTWHDGWRCAGISRKWATAEAAALAYDATCIGTSRKTNFVTKTARGLTATMVPLNQPRKRYKPNITPEMEQTVRDYLRGYMEDSSASLTEFTDLFEDYRQITEEAKDTPVGRTTFSRILTAMGYPTVKDAKGQTCKRGLRFA